MQHIQSDTKRIRAFFSGKVQGVGFRYHTQQLAVLLGLRGWVKNLDDGRVELFAEGEEEKIEKLLERLNDKFGIKDVEVKRDEKPEGFGSFTISYE